MLNFHCKLAALEFHGCTSCLERFPNLTMAARSTIRRGHLCNVHYLESDYSPDHFRVVYYWYLITSGSHPCGGDAGVCCDANHVHLSTAPWSVRIHWAHHQLTTRRSQICTFTSKTTIWGRRLDHTKGLSAVSQRLPHTQICSSLCFNYFWNSLSFCRPQASVQGLLMATSAVSSASVGLATSWIGV